MPPSPPTSPSADDDSGPAARLLDAILLDAAARNASDLHFEPDARHCRLRIRIDGVLHLCPPPPAHLRDALPARIKALAGMDIAEKRLPQDGRLSILLPAPPGERFRHHSAVANEGPARQGEAHFRVSTLPAVDGEKIVLRRLDTLPDTLDFRYLGYNAVQTVALQHALRQPHGLILTTGPTGSGKTLSLFAFLQSINCPSINICTVEDPVELRLPGLNQVTIRNKAGLTFATALRAFLRQDPDVLMIGEIRDSETAAIAVAAAQTGHRVLSTLHTNDAPSAIARLRDMGIAPYQIAATLQLVCAQRLIRRLCPHCRRADPLARPPFCPAWRAVGCQHCHGIGYQGQIGLHQVLPVSAALRALIVDAASTAAITAQARTEGISCLAMAARQAVLDGITSLNECASLGLGQDHHDHDHDQEGPDV